MKRKLFLITDFFPYGTSEAFVMTELRHLSQWFDITVIPRYKCEGEPRQLPDGVKIKKIARHMKPWEKIRFSLRYFLCGWGWRESVAIFRTGENRMGRLKDSLKYFVSSELFWKELQENGIAGESDGSVYYSFWYTAAALALSTHRAELPGAKVVVRTHGYDLYNERSSLGRQPFKPAGDEGIDRIVSCCRFGKRYYLDTFHGADSSKHCCIPLGTDRKGTVEEHSMERELRLVSCSMAVPGKRIKRIIQALAALEDVPVNWTHLGDGVQMQELRAMAEKAFAGKENISWHFAGNVDNQQVHRLYEAGSWDAFITTSATEGSPVSIQEALSYGVPVIATAVGGIPELLEGTKNILLSSDPDAQETADAIRQIWGLSPADRCSVQQENKAHWEKDYCAANNARRMMEMMEELWQQ